MTPIHIPVGHQILLQMAITELRIKTRGIICWLGYYETNLHNQ
jgi:hypothetical protein